MNECQLTECQGKPRCEHCTAMDKRYGPPAGPDEAEKLAKDAISAYLRDCRMTDGAQLGNYLMKLVSVAGVLMAAGTGSEDAAARLEGTAKFILKTMPKQPGKLRPVQ